MISGVINYGVGHTKMAHPWKALFVRPRLAHALLTEISRYFFCGSVTIAWSLVIWFFMPASPLEPGRYFNAVEREILARRFEENPFGKDRQPFRMGQTVEAMLDAKTWIYLLMGVAIYVSRPEVWSHQVN